MQLDTCLFLKVAEDAEQIACLRIAARAEHTHEALRGSIRGFAELCKADSRIDVVAQDRLAGLHVTGQHRIDAFAQKVLGERSVFCDAPLHQFLEALCDCHFRLRHFCRGRRFL